ncbi:MAG: cytochrome c3 family protein, partial [Candidatus Neomarinimicrobiota bacterium]
PVAGIPPTQTCMNCHIMVKPNSDSLLVVKDSWDNKRPIKWVRVHKSPDYVYFDHSAHVNVGVGCKSCHGRIDRMNVVMQTEPLSMSWCLECHRNPEEHLRPVSEITNMDWRPDASHKKIAQQMMQDLNITPPTGCQGCHR